MVRGKGLIRIAAAALICAACKPNAPRPERPTELGPKIRATVVTIRTTLQPQNKTFTHSLVIGDGRARAGDEVDRWRLFDLRAKQVTFIDDLARTYRSEPLATVLAEHRRGVAGPLPLPLPRAETTATGARRVLQGVQASEQVIRLGGYQRHLWIARHPALPDELFAMAQASAPVSTPLAGVMRAADEALLALRGFPFADHAEVAYGNKKLVVDREVVKIEQRDVPATWLQVPAGYKNLTAPPASPRPAS